MARALFALQVEDYATWRRTYDERHEARVRAGLGEAHVYQDVYDPNSVTVVLRGDLDKLEAYAASAAVNTSYGPAGVIGTPRVTFVDDVT